MIKFRKKLAAIIMTGFLMAGTTFAKDGWLVGDLRGEETPQTCTQTNGGIIIAGFTGIIIAGFTGIIITGAADTKTACEN